MIIIKLNYKDLSIVIIRNGSFFEGKINAF